jgi:hypothetical protein
MKPAQPVNVDWHTSTFSATMNCVEVAVIDGIVAVRDSKDPNGTVQMHSPEDWRAFLDGIANGDFDALG